MRAEEVDWSKRDEYIAKHGMTVGIANEALTDPNRVVLDPDSKSSSGESIRVYGWSDTFGGLVTVILVRHKGYLYGANAWRTDGRERREYWEVQGDG